MARIYTFGPFRLDAEAEILFHDGELVGLGGRAVAVLRALLERAGEPVSKAALIAAAWPGRVVEDANLTVQITALRRMLGEAPRGDLWIETLPRRGYRYVGPSPTETSDVAHPANLALPRVPYADPTEPVAALALPDRPSIAVLPFKNLSSDTQHDYFADGMTEEIITELSRFRQLFVIARNSSFTYKGRAVDITEVGRELGVRYVLEGSVRVAGGRIRIIGQLIDAASATHLWADRFEGGLEDIFDLQDRVTASVVGAIAPRLEHAEIKRAQKKPTESLDAYDYYLRGLASFHQSTKSSILDALGLFRRASERDPDFAAAFGMAAWCHVRRKGSRWVTDPDLEIPETRGLVWKALELARDDAVALSSAGYALSYVVGDMEQGAAFLDQAVDINPNLAGALTLCGWPKLWLGELDSAIQLQARAMRLSPRDSQSFLMQAATGMAHFCAGRYAEASSWTTRAFNNQPNWVMSLAGVAASNALVGRPDLAKEAVGLMLDLDPTLSVSCLSVWTPFRQPEHSAKWADALRRAGLPN
jgi:TolB-like protein/tetratricopeptide (TPR) repeat protein